MYHQVISLEFHYVYLHCLSTLLVIERVRLVHSENASTMSTFYSAVQVHAERGRRGSCISD